jgi:hypothetical protein
MDGKKYKGIFNKYEDDVKTFNLEAITEIVNSKEVNTAKDKQTLILELKDLKALHCNEIDLKPKSEDFEPKRL